MSRRILVFHNPFAAKEKSNAALQKITTVLQQNAIEFLVCNTMKHFDGNHKQLMELSVQFSPTEIWLSGGDGTLNLFINSLPQTMWNLPVAIIPSGTGNDFIKNYIAEYSFEGCLQIALNASPNPVDVWKCNGRLFMHGIGIGFDGQVVESMLLNQTPFSGFLAYYYHILRQLLIYRAKPFTLIANGEQMDLNGFMVTIGNGHTFGGGFKVTPHALINDGLLDICAISKVPVLKRPRYLKTIEYGNHLRLKYVNYFTTAAITLKTAITTPCHIDGELFYGETFEILPHNQKLMVIGA